MYILVGGFNPHEKMLVIGNDQPISMVEKKHYDTMNMNDNTKRIISIQVPGPNPCTLFVDVVDLVSHPLMMVGQQEDLEWTYPLVI